MSTIADEMNFNKRLAAKIRVARIDKGYSQKYLAEMLGLRQQAVSAWENGLRQPTPFHIGELCKLTGKPADFFINDD